MRESFLLQDRSYDMFGVSDQSKLQKNALSVRARYELWMLYELRRKTYVP